MLLRSSSFEWVQWSIKPSLKVGKLLIWKSLEPLCTIAFCGWWTVNWKYPSTISHLYYIWTAIVVWYIFLLVFGAMDPNISTTAYKVFIEACALDPSCWLVTLFVLISSLIPYFTHASIHQMIQWIRADGQ